MSMLVLSTPHSKSPINPFFTPNLNPRIQQNNSNRFFKKTFGGFPLKSSSGFTVKAQDTSALIANKAEKEEEVIKARDQSDHVTEEVREASPSHFLLRIESVSLLLDGSEKYESMEFTAGDYKWRLIIYPNGSETESDGSDYISVNLAVVPDTDSWSWSWSSNWEINAVFSIFLFNQKHDNYLCVRGRMRRFHALNPEWGFSKFISKQTLKEPSNGYVVDDKCVFGAEVFITTHERAIERLTMFKDAQRYLHELNIQRFSKLGTTWYSKGFIAGDLKWKISVHPKGLGKDEGRSVSIYLCSADSTFFPSYQKVKANFSVCMKNQISDEHRKDGASRWFTPGLQWGWSDFISLEDVNDPMRGFVVNDCCVLEVEILVRAITL